MKCRKNADKKWAKIWKNTEKIQKNSLKYRTFCIFLKEQSCIREFFKSILDNLHCNISVHIYDSKISVIASNYSFIHRFSEPPNKVRGPKNIIEKNRGANIWAIQKNTEYFPNYRKIQNTFEIQKIQKNTEKYRRPRGLYILHYSYTAKFVLISYTTNIP